MITLGIIGVVAAMTIPNLLTAYQKHEIQSKLKKAVSTINQAVKMSEDENGSMETWDISLSPIEYIDRYIRPYLKIVQTCKGFGSCGYVETNSWRYLNGAFGAFNSPFNYKRVPFITIDGILFVFAYASRDTFVQSDNDKLIIIDINGSRRPNTFGKDVFFLYRIEEKDSIVPYGAGKTSHAIASDCSKSGSGRYCAEYIRQHGWNIPNGYPLK